VTDYQQANMASWDERAPAHAASPDYHLDDFRSDPAFLSKVVTFDLPLLGDISGARGVHLQCHIGTDTVSLARLGASMTGVDFSAPALQLARRLAEQAGADARFVQADTYDAAKVLGAGQYDLVYTWIGALCWLPKIRPWAEVVAALLRPGGRLFIREGHPVLWALDELREDNLVVLEHAYVERDEPLVWTEGGTYVQTDVEFEHNTTYEWNHGLGEIITALFDAGLRLTGLTEHDSVPWEALPGKMDKLPLDEWRLSDRPWRLPHSYTLQAVKD
jgi:SAM-dependent methyltransferase